MNKLLIATALLAATNATAGERYMHSCNNAKPTPIMGVETLRESDVSIEFRRFYPGIRGGRYRYRNGVWYARGVSKDKLVRCKFVAGGAKPRAGRNAKK